MVINIDLPGKVKCMLKEGDKVDFDTNFLEKKSEVQVTVAIAKKLNIDPSKIFRYLKRLVGEEVKKGETLALKKGFISNQKIISQYEGIIQEIDHLKGDIIITTYIDEKKTQKCFFKGKIKEVSKTEISLEVEKSAEFPIKPTDFDFGGEAYYNKKGHDDLNSQNVAEKILVADEITDFVQVKGEALGVAGYITLSKLPELTDKNHVQFKNINDLEKVQKLNYPYCLIDKKKSLVIFYKS